VVQWIFVLLSLFLVLALQTYRHDMTYSVLKVPLNPNKPTNHPGFGIGTIYDWRQVDEEVADSQMSLTVLRSVWRASEGRCLSI